MLTLCSGGDFHAVVEQVVGVGQRCVIVMAHVIERADRRIVICDKNERTTGRLQEVGTQSALCFWVQVAILARYVIATTGHNGASLGQAHPREWAGGNSKIYLQGAGDRFAILVHYSGDACNQHVFVHRHHVFVRIDETHFRINAGEFGGVANRKRRVRSKGGGDFKYGAKARWLRHLLKELGALCQIRGGVEVTHLEQFGARFTGAGHQFWGVNFDPVVFHPPRTNAMLKSCLGTENEICAGATQVKKTPIHALINAGILRDGQLMGGGSTGCDGGNLDLKAAKFDPLIQFQRAFDGDEGALVDGRNKVSKFASLG